MYVVSEEGKMLVRYDGRTLSTTKITWMHTLRKEPVDNDRLNVDAVLVSCSTSGSSEAR